MKLGISSPLTHNSPEEWADNQVRLGCKSVVFPVGSDEPDEKIDAYKQAADSRDLMIAEVGVWRNVLSKDKDESKRNMEYCINQLKLADRIGARCCVNVAGSFGPRWDGGYRENFTKEAWTTTVESIQYIIDQADVRNTYFTIEPMPWMYPRGPKEYLKLIEAVDRERFAVHLDIINMVTGSERYFAPEEFVDECISALGSSIRSCHIKDVHLKEEYTIQLEECAPGKGEFPLAYYMKKIDELDPDIPMILEHLSTDEEYVHYFEDLKKLGGNI